MLMILNSSTKEPLYVISLFTIKFALCQKGQTSKMVIIGDADTGQHLSELWAIEILDWTRA